MQLTLAGGVRIVVLSYATYLLTSGGVMSRFLMQNYMGLMC